MSSAQASTCRGPDDCESKPFLDVGPFFIETEAAANRTARVREPQLARGGTDASCLAASAERLAPRASRPRRHDHATHINANVARGFPDRFKYPRRGARHEGFIPIGRRSQTAIRERAG